MERRGAALPLGLRRRGGGRCREWGQRGGKEATEFAVSHADRILRRCGRVDEFSLLVEFNLVPARIT
jgi:hypothetical protein